MADGTGKGGVSTDRLGEIGRAFARRDPQAIAACFAPDGEFRNAVGPDVWGQTYKGADAIVGYFTELFARSPDVRWDHTAEWACGDRAVVEWRRTATLASGEKQEWLGCDLYIFRGDLIVRKDTYIKVVR